MWGVVFDDELLRLRERSRGIVLSEVRCPVKHLQAVVLRSTHGPWAAWRPARIGGRDVWSQAWLDELVGPVAVTCHCRHVRQVTLTS